MVGGSEIYMPLCRQCHERETKAAKSIGKISHTITPQSATTTATDTSSPPIEVAQFKNPSENDSLRLGSKP